jgi:hypothetical protein
MNILKPAFLLLISALTQNALYSMNPAQRPSTGKGLELCISGLLSNPGEDTPEAMFNIIQTHGLDVALMNDYTRISACTHYIKHAFGYQNIAQISQQPGLTQCITDALRYTYEFLDDDTIRHHAHNITRQLRQTTPKMHTKRTRSHEENTCSESEESMTKKQRTQPEEVATTTHANTSVVPLWEHPHLINHIATFLPLKDRFHLACTSKATNSSLKEPNTLEHLRTFMREIANPIDYILHKAQGNPNVSIDGITYNTQEVLDFLYANIAEVLINNVYDPILYVLDQAQGSSTVEIYGKHFNTNQLIQDLYKHGADINRVCDRTDDDEETYSADIGNYSPSDDIYIPRHLEKIAIPSDIYDTLTVEQKLDSAQWHILRYALPFNRDIFEHPENSTEAMNAFYNTLIGACEKLKNEYPDDGIVIIIDGNAILTQEIIQKLSKFNIVSLLMPHSVNFLDGIKHIEQLKHVRELFICIPLNSLTTDDVKALCNLRQLRSLTIRHDYFHSNDVCITIPPEIKNLKKLRFLDLRNLWIQTLPQEIEQLEQLRLLALTEAHPLNTLTEALSSLKNLLTLKIGWAKTDENIAIAKSLVHSLKKLKNLYTYSSREITDLGDEIKHLSIGLLGIHSGYGSGPNDIPDTICLLPALKTLCVFIDDNYCLYTFSLLQYCTYNRIKFWIDHCNIGTGPDDREYNDQWLEILGLRERLVSDKALAIIPPAIREFANSRYQNALDTLTQPKEKPLHFRNEILPLYWYRTELKSILDTAAEQNTQALEHITRLKDLLSGNKETHTQILLNDLHDLSQPEQTHIMAKTLLELLDTTTISEGQLWIAHQGWLPFLEQYIKDIQEKATLLDFDRLLLQLMP